MKKIPLIIILITVITAILLPVVAEASGQNRLIALEQLPEDLRPQYAVDIPYKKGDDATQRGNIILQLIAGSLIYAAGPIAVLMIAIGGFRYVISHGEQSQMEEAKKNITWAVIGLLVIIVSYAIVENVIRISSTTSPAVTNEQPASGPGATDQPAEKDKPETTKPPPETPT